MTTDDDIETRLKSTFRPKSAPTLRSDIVGGAIRRAEQKRQVAQRQRYVLIALVLAVVGFMGGRWSEADQQVLTVPADAPPLAPVQTTTLPPESRSDELIHFTSSRASSPTREGGAVAPGDTVDITVEVDPSRYGVNGEVRSASLIMYEWTDPQARHVIEAQLRLDNLSVSDAVVVGSEKSSTLILGDIATELGDRVQTLHKDGLVQWSLGEGGRLPVGYKATILTTAEARAPSLRATWLLPIPGSPPAASNSRALAIQNATSGNADNVVVKIKLGDGESVVPGSLKVTQDGKSVTVVGIQEGLFGEGATLGTLPRESSFDITYEVSVACNTLLRSVATATVHATDFTASTDTESHLYCQPQK